MQAYSDPRREDEPTALPDIEVFEGADYCHGCDCDGCDDGEPCPHLEHDKWYWWSCFPGCLPDGEPNGPFETEEEALADAREGIEEEEDQYQVVVGNIGTV